MVSYVLSIIAAVAVAMIVWAGFRMVTMAGNGEATKKALSTIKNAVIGLAITVLAYAAIAIITNVLKGL
jgi:amino acid transporter